MDTFIKSWNVLGMPQVLFGYSHNMMTRTFQQNVDGDDDHKNDYNDDDKDDGRCVGRSGLSNQYSGRGSAHVLRTSNAFLNSLPLIMTVLWWGFCHTDDHDLQLKNHDEDDVDMKTSA